MTEWIVTSSAMILIIIALRGLLKGKTSLRLQYALWALVLARLLLPFSLVESDISVSNLLTAREANAAVEEYKESYEAVWQQYAQLGEELPEQEMEQQVQQELYDRTYERIEREYAQTGQTVLPQRIETEAKRQVDAISLTATVMELLPYLWVGGMVLVAAVLAVSNLHFAWKLRKNRTPMDIPGVPLRVYRTDFVATPCLFGIGKPGIYLTGEITEDSQMREHVITHELSHYRQKDHIWSALRCVCLVLHWYNPFVWVAAVLSKRDAELACDERTIRTLGEDQRTEYGKTLISMTCVHRDPKSLMLTATTMMGTKKALKERVRLIAKKPKAALYTLIACVVVAVIAVGCTFTGAPGETKDPTDGTTPTDPSTEATTPPTAEATEPDETNPEEPVRVNLHGVLDLDGMFYGGAPEDYYWFVYHPELDHVPPKGKDADGKTYELATGYLYNEHRDTGIVYPVLEEQVVGLHVTERYLFSLTETNTIVVADMTGQLKLELHRGEEAIQPGSLGYLDGTLYFVEGDSVRNLDLRTGSLGILTVYKGALDADPVYNVADKYPHLLYIWTDTKEYIACNLLTGETAELDTDAKVQRFLEDGTWPVEQELTVEYFTQLLSPSKGYWYHRIMGSVFEKPSEISLEHTFYTGMELISDPEGSGFLMHQRQDRDTYADTEIAYLKILSEERCGDPVNWSNDNKLPRKKVEEVLNTCLGISLADATIPDCWDYFAETDAFYDIAFDAYSVTGHKITDVTVRSDGTIQVYWNTDRIVDTRSGEMEILHNPKMVMTLRRNNDGSFLVLSNIPQ